MRTELVVAITFIFFLLLTLPRLQRISLSPIFLNPHPRTRQVLASKKSTSSAMAALFILRRNHPQQDDSKERKCSAQQATRRSGQPFSCPWNILTHVTTPISQTLGSPPHHDMSAFVYKCFFLILPSLFPLINCLVRALYYPFVRHKVCRCLFWYCIDIPFLFLRVYVCVCVFRPWHENVCSVQDSISKTYLKGQIDPIRAILKTVLM